MATMDNPAILQMKSIIFTDRAMVEDPEHKHTQEGLKPEAELWYPPEFIPAEIADIMPQEKHLAEIREILYGDMEFAPELDMVRAIVNIRRRRIYQDWLSGYYEQHPELLNIRPK